MTQTRAWMITLILASLAIVAPVDRHILVLFSPDLRAEFHITDLEFGLLNGPAFVLLYSVFLIPFAVIIDKWNRKWALIGGVVAWSVLTIASGFVATFGQLLALRGGLAIGEAVLAPAALSLIGDLFDRLERPLPTATFVVGSVIGNTGAALVGATILQSIHRWPGVMPTFGVHEPWRLTLMIVGAPGLFLAFLLIVLAREPDRGRANSNASNAAVDVQSLRSHFTSHGQLYVRVFVSIGLLAMIGVCVGTWGPTFLIRRFGMSQIQAGYLFGGSSLIAGTLSTLLVPAIMRRMMRRGELNKLVFMVAVGILVAVSALAFGVLGISMIVVIMGISVMLFLSSGFGTLPTQIIQLYAPSDARARLTAIFYFSLNLLTAGLGPVLVPWVAGAFFSGPAALGKAIGSIALAFGIVAALLFGSCGRYFQSAEANITATPT